MGTTCLPTPIPASLDISLRQVKCSPEKNLSISCLSVFYSLYNQVGGKAGGPQYHCKQSLMSGLFRTPSADSSGPRPCILPRGEEASRLPPPGGGAVIRPGTGSGLHLLLKYSSILLSSLFLPLPSEINYAANSRASQGTWLPSHCWLRVQHSWVSHARYHLHLLFSSF